MKYLALLLIAFTATGCFSTLNGTKMDVAYRQLSTVERNTSRIYFMRPGEVVLGADARVHIDGKRVVELPTSGCHYEDIAPGTHDLKLDIWGDFGSHELSGNFSRGETRYLKIWPREERKIAAVFFGTLGAAIDTLSADSKNDGSLEFVEVPKEQAIAMFKRCVLFDESIQ